jgi:WhiB family redox-sensing transcriptional regulator
MDARLFYPEPGESTTDAKGICLGCSVRGICADEAIARREQYGIWGAMSERERRRIRRERRTAA